MIFWAGPAGWIPAAGWSPELSYTEQLAELDLDLAEVARHHREVPLLENPGSISSGSPPAGAAPPDDKPARGRCSQW